MVATVLGVGWGFPVERENAAQKTGCFTVASYEESVDQAIRIILSTMKGERVMRPDFGCGLQELVFEVNNSATRGMAEFEVKEALLKWEPRIDVLDVQAVAGGDHNEMLVISIDYRIRVTDTRANLVYPFYLDRSIT